MAILERLHRAINDDGIMVIAIENRLGMKYLMGANEDHYAEPYLGSTITPMMRACAPMIGNSGLKSYLTVCFRIINSTILFQIISLPR